MKSRWSGLQSSLLESLTDFSRYGSFLLFWAFETVSAKIDGRPVQHAYTTGTREPNWRIGHGFISRNHVVIVGTVQVSAGGWMPILQISNPSAVPTSNPSHYYA